MEKRVITNESIYKTREMLDLALQAMHAEMLANMQERRAKIKEDEDFVDSAEYGVLILRYHELYMDIQEFKKTYDSLGKWLKRRQEEGII